MNKIIYIIPALGESCVESPYVMLTNALEKKRVYCKTSKSKLVQTSLGAGF